MKEDKALQEYIEVNTNPSVVITEDEQSGFLCGYRAAQYDISKAYDLLEKLDKSKRKIQFLEKCFYNELEIAFLPAKKVETHFVHIKHTKRYRCIKPLTLKYIIVEDEN